VRLQKTDCNEAAGYAAGFSAARPRAARAYRPPVASRVAICPLPGLRTAAKTNHCLLQNVRHR